MFCEQCGNEFFKSKSFKKNGKEYVKCPFCHFENEREDRRKKKNTRKDYTRGENR